MSERPPGRFRLFVRRHWPALRLRTILLSVLIFAGILPGLSAIFLRVYENALVRQTEAGLVAQSAVIAAAAETMWPGSVMVSPPPVEVREAPGYYQPEQATIDLGSTPVLAPRPAARPTPTAADPEAVQVAARVEPIAAEASRTTLASIILLDRQGIALNGYAKGGAWGDLPEVQTALSGRPETVLRRNASYRQRYSMEWVSRASALRIHHARPIVVNSQVEGVVLTSRSPRALFRGMYQDRIKIGLGIIGTLGFLAFLAVLVSRGIAGPIEALSRATREVASGGGRVPLPSSTAAVEIRTLYEDFNRMAEAVDRRSRYLRDFAAAVSHEFKTPLAGIQGAVELLQDHDDMEPDRRRRFLDNIASDSRRLSALVTRLMDLARADMARPEAGLSVDLRPAVLKAMDARSPALEVINALPADLPAVSVPEATVEMVVSTLLENSRQAGARSVRISTREAPGCVILCLTDDGPGVTPADRLRIFEPFFTTRRDQGGAGLGLSIARALLAANKATLDLAPSAAGAVFEIGLPIADA
ncbi:ATP-binding protein [Brevundimonas kwangchunensis]|uniref:histidine kinase n=1 Tax=Brevundimonas kwangchunensis TaxID=322163 RepID=A0ABP3RW47_9CAUL